MKKSITYICAGGGQYHRYGTDGFSPFRILRGWGGKTEGKTLFIDFYTSGAVHEANGARRVPFEEKVVIT